MATTTSEFITQCENEKLHLSGAIQPYGALIVVDHQQTVTHVSQNIGELWRGQVGDFLGKSAPPEMTGLLAQLNQKRRYFHAELDGPQGTLDVLLTEGTNGQMLIELMPTRRNERLRSAVGMFPHNIATEEALADYQKQLVDYIRKVTEASRVMYYEFLPTGDGEVLAEAKRADIDGSYLQLRFPASDIPQIARRLYFTSEWRAIYDANVESVAVVGVQQDDVPDLSQAELRSVSPVHLHYLRNMGVSASVSWPIKGSDDLLALISLHHDEPKALDYGVLRHVSELVENYNFALREYRTEQRIRLHDHLQAKFNHFHNRLLSGEHAENYWDDVSQWLLEEFDCDGVVLRTEHQQLTAGVTLEPDTIQALLAHMRQQGELAFISDDLQHDVAAIDLTAAAGVAVLLNAPAPKHEVAFFAVREAHMYEVAWGGRPDKPMESRDQYVPVSPRRSFEKWVEKRMAHSKPWDEHTRIKLMKLRLLLNEF
ncbi:GAF domain-containing protein [Pseudidiomarina homiensis]|uniref:Phytochrome chromophore attachment site domain-containing protein n=1 Tax=Pseudidiomarina homiensis TaxID=364198 RepID=A0A432XXX6_9GAMM|nr:GAF domain-containing protein [Pseudidiomarina homiensis]RUO53547.1 hypothetical protein CWI70_10205 [Pseudidiomarina homiensis]